MEPNNNKELSLPIHEYEKKEILKEAYVQSPCNSIHDTRIIVNVTQNLPYCYFGIISVKGNFVGTGFIVGPNLVLTAAHNINHSHMRHIKLPNMEPSQVTFSVPAEDSLTYDYEYTEYNVIKIHTSPKYDFLIYKSCHDCALLE